MPDLIRVIEEKSERAKKAFLAGGVLLIILVGLVTGYFLANRGGLGIIPGQGGGLSGAKIAKGTEVGSQDIKTFKDTSEGIIEKGGLDGEGTHRLLREGGPSQTAYLTSSVVDLDQFVGRKVKIWGQTYGGQKAGWFMDVGRVKVLE